MILRTVHVPRLYSDLPANESEIRWHCSSVVFALRDALRNCVLLVDSADVMMLDMHRGIGRWPVKYRHKAQELLKKLAKRHRLIEIGDGYDCDASCSDDGCKHALGIASSLPADVLITPPTCLCRESCLEGGVQLVPLDEYAVAPFFAKRRHAEYLQLKWGEWSKADFEAQVWEPLFRHAKHVRLFDRFVGRQLTGQMRRVREWKEAGSIGARPSVGVRSRFARALEWIFEQFIARSNPSHDRTFEVCCSLEGNLLSPPELAEAAAALRSLGSQMTTKHGQQFTLTVKVEKGDSERRHARFLFTDQIHLLVERGFDLLTDDDRMQDVVITLADEPERTEAEFRKLNDAP